MRGCGWSGAGPPLRCWRGGGRRGAQASRNEAEELRARLGKRDARVAELEAQLSAGARERGGLLAETEAKLMEAAVEADARREAEAGRREAEAAAAALRADLAKALIDTEAARREALTLQQRLVRGVSGAEDLSDAVASELEGLVDACKLAMESASGGAEEEVRGGCAQVQAMRAVVRDLRAEVSGCRAAFSRDLDAVVRAVLSPERRGAGATAAARERTAPAPPPAPPPPPPAMPHAELVESAVHAPQRRRRRQLEEEEEQQQQQQRAGNRRRQSRAFAAWAGTTTTAARAPASRARTPASRARASSTMASAPGFDADFAALYRKHVLR